MVTTEMPPSDSEQDGESRPAPATLLSDSMANIPSDQGTREPRRITFRLTIRGSHNLGVPTATGVEYIYEEHEEEVQNDDYDDDDNVTLDDYNEPDTDTDHGFTTSPNLGAGASRRRRKDGTPAFIPHDWIGTANSQDPTALSRLVDGFRTPQRNPDHIEPSPSLAVQLFHRELGAANSQHHRAKSRLILQSFIPNGSPLAILHYESRTFSGQFSKDGSLFYTTNQDMKVRVYDTSNPYDWRFLKSTRPVPGQWTLTDADMSHDKKWIAYSTISTTAYLTPTFGEPDRASIPLEIGAVPSISHLDRVFSIWALKFSRDSTELLAGMGQSYFCTYDVERRKTTNAVRAHFDEVNSVDYGGPNAPNLIYTASDDTTINIWDRRTMGMGIPVGVFFGHTEGVTSVEAHENGRYVVSNGKDQRAKLWDIRQFHSPETLRTALPNRYSTGFDYRIPSHKPRWTRSHPLDCSVQTFVGHEVLGTLVRCHFSPAGSTDSGYIYSGSYDGRIHIWHPNGDVAGIIDAYNATMSAHQSAESRELYGTDVWQVPDSSEDESESDESVGWFFDSAAWKTVVRDVSWHPSAPVIAASAWNGRHGCVGSCSIFTWDPDKEPGGSVSSNRGEHPTFSSTSPPTSATAPLHPEWEADIQRWRPKSRRGPILLDQYARIPRRR